MICPIAPILGLGLALGGAHTVFVLDRHRWLAWAATVALVAGWASYALLAREPRLRMALEAASMLALAAGAWRAIVLARRHGPSPIAARSSRALRAFGAVAVSPAVLAAQVWLAAMLTMEWRGKASFPALEYALVSALLAASIAEHVWRAARARRREPEFAALAAFADAPPAAACPLGICGPDARRAAGDGRS